MSDGKTASSLPKITTKNQEIKKQNTVPAFQKPIAMLPSFAKSIFTLSKNGFPI